MLSPPPNCVDLFFGKSKTGQRLTPKQARKLSSWLQEAACVAAWYIDGDDMTNRRTEWNSEPYDPTGEWLTTEEAAEFCDLDDGAEFRQAARRVGIEPKAGHTFIGIWARVDVERVKVAGCVWWVRGAVKASRVAGWGIVPLPY